MERHTDTDMGMEGQKLKEKNNEERQRSRWLTRNMYIWVYKENTEKTGINTVTFEIYFNEFNTDECWFQLNWRDREAKTQREERERDRWRKWVGV